MLAERSPVWPAVGLLTRGFTLFSADLEGKSGDRMDLLEASPAVRKSFSGNAGRQPDHSRERYSDDNVQRWL